MARHRIRKDPVTQATLFGEEIIGWAAPEKDICIVECDKTVADKVIVPHHYSHKVTQNSCLSMLVKTIGGGRIMGALQMGYGIRPKIKGEYETDSTREFDRMWLSDEQPKYSETIVLSLFHHYLRKMHPEVKYLISYADTSAGNKGTIYKAANYKLIDDIKADFYILATGERVHPVSMYHRHHSRAWGLLQQLYPGIRKADGRQLKFLFEL